MIFIISVVRIVNMVMNFDYMNFFYGFFGRQEFVRVFDLVGSMCMNVVVRIILVVKVFMIKKVILFDLRNLFC